MVQPRWWSWLSSVIAAPAGMVALIAVAATAGGCATSARTRRFPPSVFQSARIAARPGRARIAPVPAANEGAALVESRLRAAGLRFGTDGSARALWGYMRLSHRIIGAADARTGDILFFDMRGRQDRQPDCADHAGIVERVDPDGRITFMEARGGEIRR